MRYLALPPPLSLALVCLAMLSVKKRACLPLLRYVKVVRDRDTAAA